VRPLKLTMQAFGPYADTECIDFTKLGNRTMFVISGKTGAGKTTIFDAISYAIYGKASGEDRNGPELRSHFASDNLLTEVSLEFSLRNKTYYISRSPQQPKKKDKGEGYTQLGAKAELYIYEDGEKKLLASKINDVEEKIKEIMLIDANQFRQILMIPQGEFRKLLTSDSKDKEQILQRLFHTQLYKQIEEKLKAEATELKTSVETQKQARNEAIRRIQVEVSEELQEYLTAGSENHILILPLLKTEIDEMGYLLDQLKNQIIEKTKEQDTLKEKLFEAENIVKQIQTKEELKTQKHRLESQEEIITEKEKQVIRAQKAALLEKQDELCYRLRREADGLAANVRTIEASIEQWDKQVKQYHEQLEKETSREGERGSALAEVNRLSNMKDDVYSFAALMKETSSVEAALTKAKAQQHISEQKLEQVEQQQKLLIEQKETIDKGQLIYLENKSKLEKIQSELERFDKYEQLQNRYQMAEQSLKLARGRYENTASRLQDAKKLVADLEKKWLHGQAAILAASLQEGEPCPVCGSPHHPSLALNKTDVIPNEADLEAAKQNAAKCEQEKSKDEASLYQWQSEVKVQKDAIDDIENEIRLGRPNFVASDLAYLKSEMETEKNSSVQQQSRLAAQIQEMDVVKKKIENKESERQALLKSIQEQSTYAAELTIQYTEKKTNLSRMMNAIPENIRSEEQYEQAILTAKQRYELLMKKLETAQEQFRNSKEKLTAESARLKDAQKHLTDKLEELNVEREVFKQKLSEQGFENYNAFHSSKLAEGEIHRLESEIRNYREELRSVTDRLNELTNLLKDIKAPDVDNIKVGLSKLEAELEGLNQQHTNLFVKRRDNEEIYQRIIEINGDIKDLEERYNLIGDLYDITKGQNNLKITFERYVLAAFLDNILREANVRLKKMTSGRFLLKRKTDRSKGNAQGGLELLVFDQYTGQERHVKTLSGGESFKASLALALGLADVVQNYAGGVSLETMFIDEGFGTLDPESLEQAIEALTDIQNGGRLVGIISHVPELKERIDVRLEVISGQAGSRTEFVFTS